MIEILNYVTPDILRDVYDQHGDLELIVQPSSQHQHLYERAHIYDVIIAYDEASGENRLFLECENPYPSSALTLGTFLQRVEGVRGDMIIMKKSFNQWGELRGDVVVDLNEGCAYIEWE